MNVLFITVAWPKPHSYNLYSDLMSEFVEHGHSVYVSSIDEKKSKGAVASDENGIRVLRVASGGVQQTNKYLKVINTVLVGIRTRRYIFRLFKNVRFDILLFATPPITMILDVIRIKKHFGIPMYLLLKDIWPQDTVDIGGMTKGGIVWKIFRWLERKTYAASSYIGCMSPAARDYVLRENKGIPDRVVEVCPNCQKDRILSTSRISGLREKYQIPENAVLYIYGGNLGIPQGIDFLFDIAKRFDRKKNVFLLIVGGGTEFDRLKSGLASINAENVKLLPTVEKYEYDSLVCESDVGLVLLHPNATVPNFPSRLLSYIQLGKPVIAAVDEATDLGHILEYYGCGKNCRNGDVVNFMEAVDYYNNPVIRNDAGKKARELFLRCYTADTGYHIIMSHFSKDESYGFLNEVALVGGY